MKQRLRYLLVIGLSVSALTVTPLVLAVDGTTEHDTTTTQPSTTEGHKTTTMKERVEKLKADLKIKLTTVEQDRLKQRCKAAQAVVATLNTRFGKSVTTRSNAYDNLVRHLTDIIAKLKAKNVDTTKLEQEKTTLEAKISTYKADLAKYKEALSDLKDVDCVADPTAFKAALESARTAHQALVADTAAIKSYVVDTIKVTLHDIRAQLAAKESSNAGNEGGNQ